MAVEKQTFDNLMHKVEQHTIISFSLKEQLKKIVFEEFYAEGIYILNHREIQVKSGLIMSGSAREFTINKDDKSELTEWFWFENQFMYTTPGFFSQQPAESYIETLEDTHLVYIDFKNFQILKKAYPETEHFSELIRDDRKRLYNSYINQLKMLKSKERYQLLFKAYPKLFNVARQKDIASFLGITPDTLGKLRKSEF